MKLLSYLLIFSVLFISCKKDPPADTNKEIKIKLRMSNGSPLLYAIVQINTDDGEVSNGLVDMEGDVMVKIPNEAKYYVAIYNAGTFGTIYPLVVQTHYGNTSNAVMTVSIPVTSSAITTFTGSAKNCDGTPIINGAVKVKPQTLQLPFEYLIPVKNGIYSAGVFFGFHQSLGAGFHNEYTVRNYDSGTESSGLTAIAMVGQVNNINLDQCPYNNFYVKYTTGGDTTRIYPETPDVLNFHCKSSIQYGGSRIFALNGEYLELVSSYSGIGEFSNPVIGPIKISGNQFITDLSIPNKMVFTRYDNYENGKVEGYIKMNAFKNGDPVSIPLYVEFRLKRLHGQ